MGDRKILIEPNSGFCKQTKTFRSLRSPVDLPSPDDFPLSAADFALSLLPSWPWYTSSTTYLIDSATGNRLSYSEFTQRVRNLAGTLKSRIPLSKGDAAFLLLPNSTYVPILYFSLLSLGLIVCPSNPAADESEIQRQMQIGKPVIAFTTFENRHKTSGVRYGTISIDSSEFESMMECRHNEIAKVEVSQNDMAAIIFSSGTTGLVKGVALTHKNLISVIGIYYALRRGREIPPVQLLTTPLFHIYGFFYSLRAVALCETAVIWTSSVFDEKEFLKAVEEFRVTHAAATPPLLGAMVMGDVTDGYDTTSLESVACGGSPLKKSVIESFRKKFPGALIRQGYGLTESTGAAFRSLSEEECRKWGSVGRLLPNFEAKIVGLGSEFVESGLPSMKKGELWIRGPTIMRGYVDDPEASRKTLSDDGWLRTGDFCYIDEEGFLFVVDRVKELIQCDDGYQVSPAEIEQILHSHPLIADAAVIGDGDEEKTAIAFVVVEDKNILMSEAEVMDFIREKLHNHHQIIRKVAFVSFIPKSPAGKILRKDLKAGFLC